MFPATELSRGAPAFTNSAAKQRLNRAGDYTGPCPFGGQLRFSFMSTQQALLFLKEMRGNEHLRSTLKARQQVLRLEDIVAAGGAHGFVFDVSHLREAFRQDWAFRTLHERRKGATSVT